MLFWNPNAPETQFFFNDLDPDTGAVFTVLYDVEKRKRVKEYRFGTEAIANGGVAPSGKFFAGINYGKISRLVLQNCTTKPLTCLQGEVNVERLRTYYTGSVETLDRDYIRRCRETCWV